VAQVGDAFPFSIARLPTVYRRVYAVYHCVTISCSNFSMPEFKRTFEKVVNIN